MYIAIIPYLCNKCYIEPYSILVSAVVCLFGWFLTCIFGLSGIHSRMRSVDMDPFPPVAWHLFQQYLLKVQFFSTELKYNPIIILKNSVLFASASSTIVTLDNGEFIKGSTVKAEMGPPHSQIDWVPGSGTEVPSQDVCRRKERVSKRMSKYKPQRSCSSNLLQRSEDIQNVRPQCCGSAFKHARYVPQIAKISFVTPDIKIKYGTICLKFVHLNYFNDLSIFIIILKAHFKWALTKGVFLFMYFPKTTIQQGIIIENTLACSAAFWLARISTYRATGHGNSSLSSSWQALCKAEETWASRSRDCFLWPAGSFFLQPGNQLGPEPSA